MNKPNTIPSISRDYLKTLEYKTPYYVFDRNSIRSNIDQFKKLIPDVKIHYAMKSNPHPEVLKTIHAHGSGFEIASSNELKQLKSIKVSPKDILYSAPVKSEQFIKEAYQYGVDRFAFDSKSELDKISRVAPGSRVYLRLFVSEHGSRFSLSEKFGAKPENALELMQYAQDLGLEVYGLTFHIGSQAVSKGTWTYAIRTAANVMNLLLENNIQIKMLDIGGGFPIEYTEPAPSIDEICTVINRALQHYLPYQIELVIEPGRAIVATSAVLVSSIIARIKRGRNMWLFMDAGSYNSLFETLESQTSMRFEVDTYLEDYDKSRVNKYTLTGPTCDSIDTMMKSVELPSQLKTGDKLYFKSVGAYSIALANSFNGFDPPEAYFIN